MLLLFCLITDHLFKCTWQLSFLLIFRCPNKDSAEYALPQYAPSMFSTDVFPKRRGLVIHKNRFFVLIRWFIFSMMPDLSTKYGSFSSLWNRKSLSLEQSGQAHFNSPAPQSWGAWTLCAPSTAAWRHHSFRASAQPARRTFYFIGKAKNLSLHSNKVFPIKEQRIRLCRIPWLFHYVTLPSA